MVNRNSSWFNQQKPGCWWEYHPRIKHGNSNPLEIKIRMGQIIEPNGKFPSKPWQRYRRVSILGASDYPLNCVIVFAMNIIFCPFLPPFGTPVFLRSTRLSATQQAASCRTFDVPVFWGIATYSWLILNSWQYLIRVIHIAFYQLSL